MEHIFLFLHLRQLDLGVDIILNQGLKDEVLCRNLIHRLTGDFVLVIWSQVLHEIFVFGLELLGMMGGHDEFENVLFERSR